tara:strand:- start:8856 stop:9833 length:978 start_codon:yes stop_codon:yes gene_type:complete
MRIIFFGTPDFAAKILEKLIVNKNNIICAVTAPDKQRGRNNKIIPTEVKIVALKNKVPVLNPENLKDQLFIDALKSYNADLFVVVAFRFLPQIVWNIPAKGCINLHTSYLPNYKGAAPINRVLFNNENHTGVTTFYINEHIDSGKIIMREKIPINNDTTAGQLYISLRENGYKLLEKTLVKIKNNIFNNEIINTEITEKYAPKLTKELLKIDWNKSAAEIHNLIRGLSPFINKNLILKNISICPSAWFILKQNDINIRVKIQLSILSKRTTRPHLYIDTDNKKYLKIAVNGKYLEISQLQLEGKRSMDIKTFLQGNKIINSSEIL